MKFNRESGILLHPTSLPSKYGIGDLGKEAFDFIDFLKKGSQRLWQILPLGPVGYGESPYQCFSAFAGNTMLISIDKLVEEGLLDGEDIKDIETYDNYKVEFERVKKLKEGLYKKAFKAFKALGTVEQYQQFLNNNKLWLEDYSFFMALKDNFGGVAWNYWDREIAFRKAQAIEYYKNILEEQIEYHRFLQFKFFSQWMELKQYANSNGIKIVGDLPIFISYDSSDAWARPELFELDDEGNPSKVAGVPPDYFSATGQLWGNPHYKWDLMEGEGFQWWIDRIKSTLEVVDIVRIDHFRGFEAYWEIPGGEKTAINGRWIKAPGDKLFTVIKEKLGDLPIIAEDLGVITPEVEELKNKFSFPGMKILQFAFGGGAEERFLPHHYEEDAVVYTGTHDNDTTLGWYKKALVSEVEAIECARKYFNLDTNVAEEEICWKFIEIAYQSNCNLAIIPLQDVLCLDTQARMNYPGTIGGNWEWRFAKEQLSEKISQRLQGLSQQYKRNI